MHATSLEIIIHKKMNAALNTLCDVGRACLCVLSVPVSVGLPPACEIQNIQYNIYIIINIGF